MRGPIRGLADGANLQGLARASCATDMVCALLWRHFWHECFLYITDLHVLVQLACGIATERQARRRWLEKYAQTRVDLGEKIKG